MFEAIRHFFEKVEEARRRDLEKIEFDGYGFMKRVYGLDHTPAQGAEASKHDTLTGCYNPKAFEEVGDQEIAVVRRYQVPMTAVILYLTNLKSIEEHYGLSEEQEVIKEVAAYLKTVIRSSDILFRWQTGIFVILLSHTALEGAKVAADAFDKKVEAHPYGINEHPWCKASVVPFDSEHDDAGTFKKAIEEEIARLVASIKPGSE